MMRGRIQNGDRQPERRGFGRDGAVEPLRRCAGGISADDICFLHRLETEASRRPNGSRPLTRDEEARVFSLFKKASGRLGDRHSKPKPRKEGSPSRLQPDMETLEETIRIARSIVVMANQGIVHDIAGSILRRRRLHHLTMDDLVQEGNLAIIDGAMDGFDPSLGYRFITYAMWWIRKRMGSAIYDKENDGDVRLPQSIRRAFGRVADLIKTHYGKTGKWPSREQMMECSGMDPAELLAYRFRKADMVHEIDGNKIDLFDILADPEQISPDETLRRRDMERVVGNLFMSLGWREGDVIRKRYGFEGDAQTLEEIGDEHGLTRERVRQIEGLALRKMRKRCRNELKGEPI